MTRFETETKDNSEITYLFVSRKNRMYNMWEDYLKLIITGLLRAIYQVEWHRLSEVEELIKSDSQYSCIEMIWS